MARALLSLILIKSLPRAMAFFLPMAAKPGATARPAGILPIGLIPISIPTTSKLLPLLLIWTLKCLSRLKPVPGAQCRARASGLPGSEIKARALPAGLAITSYRKPALVGLAVPRPKARVPLLGASSIRAGFLATAGDMPCMAIDRALSIARPVELWMTVSTENRFVLSLV